MRRQRAHCTRPCPSVSHQCPKAWHQSVITRFPHSATEVGRGPHASVARFRIFRIRLRRFMQAGARLRFHQSARPKAMPIVLANMVPPLARYAPFLLTHQRALHMLQLKIAAVSTDAMTATPSQPIARVLATNGWPSAISICAHQPQPARARQPCALVKRQWRQLWQCFTKTLPADHHQNVVHNARSDPQYKGHAPLRSPRARARVRDASNPEAEIMSPTRGQSPESGASRACHAA